MSSRRRRYPPVLLLLCGLLAALPAAAGTLSYQRLSEAGRRALSPEIAVGPDGAINVIWLDKGLAADRPAPKRHRPGEHSHRSMTDLYFSRSEDGGRSWSAPRRVNRQPGEVWGFAVSKPRIAVGPSGTIHVFYPANDRSPATGLDVVSARYTRSTDRGRSFSQPLTINRPADFDKTGLLGEGLSATFSFGTMDVGPDGTVYTAWQDIGGMRDNADGAAAAMAISRDDGRSFEAPRTVIESGRVCPCCQLTLAFGADEVLLGYRRIYPDGRDSTLAISRDGGRRFSLERRLPMGHWQIDGCPLKPTEAASDGPRVYAAAYTGGEDPPGVYFTWSADGGETFAPAVPVHPGAAYSDAPQLAVVGEGRVRIVWQAKQGGPRRLYFAGSNDGGRTLSAPQELPAPPGSAAYPAVAAGPGGLVYVAWQQAGEQVYVGRIPAAAPAVARTARGD